jgi:hypothetical protein
LQLRNQAAAKTYGVPPVSQPFMVGAYPFPGHAPHWVFGDSVTYGWAVNDEESYPWLLQERFPEYEMVNFGVSGYGLIHSLIQLREALQNRVPPKLVILTYASWMDIRNTLIRERRKMLTANNHSGQLNQLYARLNDDSSLEILMAQADYKEFPLMRYSALVHAIEESYNHYEERNSGGHELTQAILQEIIELCRNFSVELILANLTHDPQTFDTGEYCRREGVKVVDIYVDTKIKENNSLPFDSHPSAAAHRQYARKLGSFLQGNVLKE